MQHLLTKLLRSNRLLPNSATIRNLAGFRVFADKVSGSKEVRAEPFAAQVQGGNVSLVAGNWHYALLDEMESFPQGKYRDQVDASVGP